MGNDKPSIDVTPRIIYYQGQARMATILEERGGVVRELRIAKVGDNYLVGEPGEKPSELSENQLRIIQGQGTRGLPLTKILGCEEQSVRKTLNEAGIEAYHQQI